MKVQSLLATLGFAIAATAFSTGAAAEDKCSATVDSTDAMRFDTDVVVVDKSCEKFTVTLTHSGQLKENVMGHNWVLTKADDVEATAKDGMAAGLENDYVKPDDERVIAHTDVIGGGEQTSVTFDVKKLDPKSVYTYFCSFPGHYAVMRGTLSVK